MKNKNIYSLLSCGTSALLFALMACSSDSKFATQSNARVKPATKPSEFPSDTKKPASKSGAENIGKGIGDDALAESQVKSKKKDKPIGEILKDLPGMSTTVTDICNVKTAAKVLILDLKSGWFAGDGGDFFKGFVATKCADLVEVSYAHITQKLIESNFESSKSSAGVLPCLPAGKTSARFDTDSCRLGSLAAYDQVWVLSGSSQDAEDLDPAELFFKSIVTRIQELSIAKPKAGFFLSAGLGNSEHVNAIAKAVFDESAGYFGLNPETKQGLLPNPKAFRTYKVSPLSAGNGITAGSFLNTAPLFQGLLGLPDYAKENHGVAESEASMIFAAFIGIQAIPKSENIYGNCFADPIITTKFESLATDACGRLTVAQGKVREHKMILEGNTARFYLTKPEDYYHRIIANLYSN